MSSLMLSRLVTAFLPRIKRLLISWLQPPSAVILQSPQNKGLSLFPMFPHQVAQTVKHLPTMWEIWFWSLGLEDSLEKEMATHSRILDWEIQWTEDPVHGVAKSQTRLNDFTMELDAMIFVFWMLGLKQAFSLSSLTFIKRLFSFSLLSAIRVMPSVYLRLLIFFPALMIPACASSSQTFYIMYSAYKTSRWQYPA